MSALTLLGGTDVFTDRDLDRCPTAETAHERLLESAALLLVTRGVIAVTVEAVAERAAVPVSWIYRWWPSEEALVLDALRREWIALAREESARSCRRDRG